MVFTFPYHYFYPVRLQMGSTTFKVLGGSLVSSQALTHRASHGTPELECFIMNNGKYIM